MRLMLGALSAFWLASCSAVPTSITSQILTPGGSSVCIVQMDTRDLGPQYSRYAANNEKTCHSSSVPCTYIFSNGTGASFGPDAYPVYWGKVFAVQAVMAEKDCGTVFWVDTDAVITTRDVANLELAMEGKAMLVSTDPFGFLASSSVSSNTSFNAGVWGVRNSADGRMLLNLWTSEYNGDKWTKTLGESGITQWTCSGCTWAGVDYEQGSFLQNILPKFGPDSNDHKITVVDWRVLNNVDCHANDAALAHHFMQCGPEHEMGCCGTPWCADNFWQNFMQPGTCDVPFDFQFLEPIPGSRFVDMPATAVAPDSQHTLASDAPVPRSPSSMTLACVDDPSCRPPPKFPLIIDTDLGLDDLAALAALASEPAPYDLTLVTTVHGMCPPDGLSGMSPLELCRSVLDKLGLTHVGCAGGETSSPPDGSYKLAELAYANDDHLWAREYLAKLGQLVGKLDLPHVHMAEAVQASATVAADAMLQAARDTGGNVTILALGALTNVRRLAELHPAAYRALFRRVIFADHADRRSASNARLTAGSLTIDNFNTWLDPAAVEGVLEASGADGGVPLTVVGGIMEASAELTNAAHDGGLTRARSPRHVAPSAAMLSTLGHWYPTALALDPTAVAFLRIPGAFSTTQSRVTACSEVLISGGGCLRAGSAATYGVELASAPNTTQFIRFLHDAMARTCGAGAVVGCPPPEPVRSADD